MEKSLVTGLAIGGIFIFILGGGLGIVYQKQQILPSSQQPLTQPTVQQNSTLVRILSSTAVAPIVAYGSVTEINGKDITLNSGKSKLTISTNQNAKIYLPVVQNNVGTKSPAVALLGKFEDIKVGDNLNITLKVSKDGTIGGEIISILSSVVK